MHRGITLLNRIILFFAILFLLGLFIFSQKTFAATVPVKVLYQVDQNYPPLTYSNQNHIYGFDPDFINLIFNSNDYNVIYSYDTWPLVYERVVQGEIDIAGIIAITDERKSEILYTDPLFSSSVSVYTRKDFKTITLDDFDKLSIGVGLGYYTEDILKKDLKLTNYIAYSDLNQAIDDLENGKIDAIFEDHWLMDSLFVTRKDKGSFETQMTDLYTSPHAYAVNKNKPELVEYMNARIKELKKNGIFEEMYMKYFYLHSDYYQQSRRNQILLIVVTTVIATLLLLFILKLYIDILKRRLSLNYEKLKKVNTDLTGAHDALQSQYEEIQAQYEEIETNRYSLEKSEERYRLIASAANECLWDWDITLDILYIADKWAERINFPSSTIPNFSKVWRNYITILDDAIFINKLENFWHGNLEHFSEEVKVKFAGPDFFWLIIKATIIRNIDNIPLRMAGTFSDISKQKESENKIYQLAYFDYLTKIPNRFQLQEKLDQILENANESSDLTALYYLDLDNFKHINDTLGHTYGDLLLIAIAQKLNCLVSEHFSVFRVGGDEFIIIIEKLSTNQEIIDWADKILNLIRQDWKLPEGETYVSASIGITVIPEDGLDSHKILKSADAAMFEAKDEGKGNYKLFHEDMLRKVSSRSEMEIQLRKAIEKNSFEVHYQPYYRISDQKLVGMEALIRWNHPVMGAIPPSVFIPIAEEMGLIREIGQWVMEATCIQNKAWQEKGYEKLPIAVNVSQLQLEDKEFIPKLLHILMSTKLDPQYLHIEVTESCIMKSPSKNIELLKEVKKMGVQISLDDFGTGYSSLNYLQNLPIDSVKIDKSFIDEILKRSPETLILSEIISIAHKLKMTVIAEGLEHLEQIVYLKEQKCDYMQGYIMNRPMSANQLEEILL